MSGCLVSDELNSKIYIRMNKLFKIVIVLFFYIKCFKCTGCM